MRSARALGRTTALASLVAVASTAGCKSAPPPVHEAPAASHEAAEPPPPGPTRTDFRTIAGKLVQRCLGGGWISHWRAEQADVDAIPRPRIFLGPFEDRTGQNLDPTYLNSVLEARMRSSGGFEIAPESGPYDFVGKGQILRLAENGPRGTRISVYTATLKFVNPKDEKVAYTCEATVRGEM